MSQYSHEQILETVPSHLQQYVVEQQYDRYTPRDQAVWRYVMRKNINFLADHAHPSYLSGLEKTGISIEKIPNVEEMNAALDQIGWRAVVVNGFIPPAAFMEFQAHRILVISAEMRTAEHILYTPAPDIIHEAAGHAPIIADETYAEYLRRFGEIGSKAMASRLDFDVYEAIRHLSIIKEFPNTTAEEIKKAEKDLKKKIEANSDASEAALLSRLHWWTVEYGLIGTPEKFKQYGAGLLSSVGESQHCLSAEVKKIPLSTACINYDYDITKMQPHLFVTENWEQLNDVLEEFASTMCFYRGGMDSIKKAIESESVATLVFSSGLQISGKVTDVIQDISGNEVYIKTSGATALAFNYKQLDGHGISYHSDGFGSPLGLLKGSTKPLEYFNVENLKQYDIEKNSRTRLEFISGINLEGTTKDIVYAGGKLILIKFRDCAVKDNRGEILFNPEWGDYDMAVGEKIISVFAGTADKEKYNVLPPRSEETAIVIEYSAKEKDLFDMYQKVREMRTSQNKDLDQITTIAKRLSKEYRLEWLIRLELTELIKDISAEKNLYDRLIAELEKLRAQSGEYNELIKSGLELLDEIPKPVENN